MSGAGDGGPRLAGTTLAVGLATGIGYLGFLARDILTARLFGLGEAVALYQLASYLPLFLASTLAGPLYSSLVPEITMRREAGGLDAAWLGRLAGAVSLAFAVAAAASLALRSRATLYGVQPTPALPALGGELRFRKVKGQGIDPKLLNGRPLDRDLSAVLAREVRIANDANCFALSEASDGAGAGKRTVFGVILGTGVGGGVIVDGKVLIGPNAIAGEWGHNPLPWPGDDERPGPKCYCGKQGCIETFLSGPALALQFVQSTGRSGDPATIAHLADDGEVMRPEQPRHAAEGAAELAREGGLDDLHDRIVAGTLEPLTLRGARDFRRLVSESLQQTANTVVAFGRAEQHRHDLPFSELAREIGKHLIARRLDVGEQLFHQVIVVVGKLLQHLIARFVLAILHIGWDRDDFGCRVLAIDERALKREIDVRRTRASPPGATKASVWPVHGAWNRETESLYSVWIEKLFDAPLDAAPSWPAGRPLALFPSARADSRPARLPPRAESGRW